MKINRCLDLKSDLDRRSVLLLGPRQTGKSSYIRDALPIVPDFNVTLLDQALYLEWMKRPGAMREAILARPKVTGLIVIDEFQRLPDLLNEVHLMIEEHNFRFLLTGSSARKLRKQGVNLLGGRALKRTMLPFTYWELKDHFILEKALTNGLMPSLYFSDDFEQDIAAYVGIYLQEEISQEGLSRNLPAFVRFLEVAAHCNAKQLNYTAIASDVGVSRVTIQNYFQLLVDTLIGDYLEPWTGHKKRKSVTTPKFYLFDAGVTRNLRGLGPIGTGSADYGDFFEHFIYHHLKAYVAYKSNLSTLHYWRTTDGIEVDFILDGRIAIEVKSKKSPTDKDLKGLKLLQAEHTMHACLLVCQCDGAALRDGILVLPFLEFFDRLWAGEWAKERL